LKVGCFAAAPACESPRRIEARAWLDLHAVVTMFDSGGLVGVLRDELGVLPPGDVLKCALTLARNERGSARKILLSRAFPSIEHERLAGHTGGGNLLLVDDGAIHPATSWRPSTVLRSLLGLPCSCVADHHRAAASILLPLRRWVTGRGEVEVWMRGRSHTARQLSACASTSAR
jgi:hypothetical protein